MKRHWAWRGALAALLTAVGCGPVAAHPGAWPAIPAATLNAMESGSSLRITSLTSAQAIGLARSEATAMRAALAQQPHGSRVLGMTLAREGWPREGSPARDRKGGAKEAAIGPA